MSGHKIHQHCSLIFISLRHGFVCHQYRVIYQDDLLWLPLRKDILPGVVVSNPTDRNVTCSSGCSLAYFSASAGEYDMNLRAPVLWLLQAHLGVQALAPDHQMYRLLHLFQCQINSFIYKTNWCYTNWTSRSKSVLPMAAVYGFQAEISCVRSTHFHDPHFRTIIVSMISLAVFHDKNSSMSSSVSLSSSSVIFAIATPACTIT